MLYFSIDPQKKACQNLPLAGPFPKLNDKSPDDVGPAEPGAEKKKRSGS